jgi:hypothetical protein
MVFTEQHPPPGCWERPTFPPVNTFRFPDTGAEGWVYRADLPHVLWWWLEDGEPERLPTSDIPPEHV